MADAESLLNWAMENRQDPRADKVIKKLWEDSVPEDLPPEARMQLEAEIRPPLSIKEKMASGVESALQATEAPSPISAMGLGGESNVPRKIAEGVKHVAQNPKEVAKEVATYPLKHPGEFTGGALAALATKRPTLVAAGAAGGRVLEEAIRASIKPPDKSISKDDSLSLIEKTIKGARSSVIPSEERAKKLPDIASKGAETFLSTLAGDYLMKGVGNVVGKEIIGPAVDKIAKTASWGTPRAVAKNVGNFFSQVFRHTPDNFKAHYKDKLSLSLLEKYKVPQAATARMMDRGADKVLKPEYFDSFAKGSPIEEISQGTIKKVSGMTKDIMKNVSTEYEVELGSVLKGTEMADPSPIVKGFREDLLSISKTGDTVKGMGKKGVTPKYGSEKEAWNDVVSLQEDVDSFLDKESVSLLDLHEFKRTINTYLGKSKVMENKRVKDLMMGLKTKVVDLIEENSDVYRAENAKYREFINLSDNIKGMSDSGKVNALLKKYFNKDSTNLKSSIDTYISKASPEVRDAWENALDEQTSRYFNEIIEDGARTPGVTVGLAGFRVGTPIAKIGGKTGKQRAKELYMASKKGTPYRTKKVATSEGLTSVGAGAGARELLKKLRGEDE